MLFSSNTFLFGFLPITVLAYYLSPKKFRNLVLLLASLVFYGWGEPRFLPLMLVSILLNYGCGRAVAARQAAGKDPKAALWAGVAVNLAMLGFFKYGRFFFGDRFPDIPLPIGISFYIFQAMSYVIDVSREQVPVQKNVLTFGTYVALFPQLIAGPIVRYRDVARELEDRRESGAQFAAGVLRFTLGLSKKVLLANTFGSAWNVLREGAGMTSGWIGLMCYTLQIYFDFSGYSDMAIGMGRIFGFKYPENFRLPYTSRSITEFWRRWHISLGSFFRDYVYIPLGGKKKHRLLNMAIVWALTGMWHGASWNFVLWGLYFFVILAIEKQVGEKSMRRVPYLLRRLGTMLLIIFGWNIFYYTDMTRLVQNFGVMFGLYGAGFSNAQAGIQLTNNLPLLLLCAIGATSIPRNLGSLFGGVCAQGGKKSGQIIYAAVSFVFDAALLALSTIALVGSTYNAFLYFRF